MRQTYLMILGFIFAFSGLAHASERPPASAYDQAILRDHPVLYLPLAAPRGSAVERDLSGAGHLGTYLPERSDPAKTRMPNGDVATVFNGDGDYLEVPSASTFSVPRRGTLTIEAWIRPDTLEFPVQEGEGFVYWAGKGEPGQYEYAGRMYSRTNTASPPRPNRISGYAFNLDGGLGSGSYFQDPVTAGTWIYVAILIGPEDVSIYKAAVLRKTTPLSQFNVTPEPGSAPLRIGTRDLNSFFKGAIGKVALYDKALTASQLKAHEQAMTGGR
jgi:hypothetical protein